MFQSSFRTNRADTGRSLGPKDSDREILGCCQGFSVSILMNFTSAGPSDLDICFSAKVSSPEWIPPCHQDCGKKHMSNLRNSRSFYISYIPGSINVNKIYLMFGVQCQPESKNNKTVCQCMPLWDMRVPFFYSPCRPGPSVQLGWFPARSPSRRHRRSVGQLRHKTIALCLIQWRILTND